MLTTAGYEWNRAMRVGLVCYLWPVQPLCRTCHIPVCGEIYCLRHLTAELSSSLERFCFVSIIWYVYNSPAVFRRCVLYPTLTFYWSCVFVRDLLWPPRGATFLKNALTKTFHGQQPPVFALQEKYANREQMLHTQIKVVNKVFSSFLSFTTLCLFRRQKHINTPATNRQRSESRHLNMIISKNTSWLFY